MVVNGILLTVTALTVAFVYVWIRSPSLRQRIEAPKYGVLEWPDRSRPEEHPGQG
jgi:hypothetical protein